MYVIMVYDVGEERVGRACKFGRRFLNWVQNSVFEGELSESKLQRLEDGMRDLMNEDEDSLLLYVLRDQMWMDRRTFGIDKGGTDNFL